jgi:hypothetical protein
VAPPHVTVCWGCWATASANVECSYNKPCSSGSRSAALSRRPLVCTRLSLWLPRCVPQGSAARHPAPGVPGRPSPAACWLPAGRTASPPVRSWGGVRWPPQPRGCIPDGTGKIAFEIPASITAPATPFCFCTTQKHLAVKIDIIANNKIGQTRLWPFSHNQIAGKWQADEGLIARV